jgi:capsular polysaccharide biosynthesis protein
MNKKGIKIVDVYELSTLQEQIDIVQSARNIIVEHGSAWFINGLILSSNIHIIVLNKLPIGIFNFELELLKEQNNTCEFIESIKDCNNIIIDIQYLEKRIDELST